MKAVRYHEYGSADVLRYEDVETPEPGPGEVRIKVQACGVNHFDVDLRDVWQVDKPFLERYTKDELRFIAQECGLVAHVSEKAFAKLLSAKKADLIAGMLNATGFDWAGRLPSSMTLDGQYGPPPVRTAAPVAALAA